CLSKVPFQVRRHPSATAACGFSHRAATRPGIPKRLACARLAPHQAIQSRARLGCRSIIARPPANEPAPAAASRRAPAPATDAKPGGAERARHLSELLRK